LGGIVFSSFSSFIGIKYQVNKETKGSLYTSLAGASANVLLNIIFIPIYGLYGAAAATLAGFILMFLLRVKNSDHFIKLSSVDTKFFAVGIIVCIAVGVVNTIEIKLLSYYLLAFGGIFFFIFNKEFIAQTIGSLKKHDV
jgi:O-antigen/teichoic acid export membrane protein